MATRVASANVLVTLDDKAAEKALLTVLAERPHIIGLQEWSRGRAKLLKRHSLVTRSPKLRKQLGRMPTEGYVFGYPLGGGPPVGVDAAWGELLAVRTIVLDPGSKRIRATLATEALVRKHGGPVRAALNLHLLAHHDDPEYLAGFKRGKDAAEEWVDSWAGFSRYVIGDTNKHLMSLPPLVSCWAGNHPEPTFADRTIDNVYSNRGADGAYAIETPSDHDVVVADYDD